MSENACSICLQEYDDDTQTYTLDSCGHKFHTKCIVDWFRRASTCPCCRNNNVENFDNIGSSAYKEESIHNTFNYKQVLIKGKSIVLK